MQLTKSRAFVAVRDSAFRANINQVSKNDFNSSTCTSSEFAHLLLVYNENIFM